MAEEIKIAFLPPSLLLLHFSYTNPSKLEKEGKNCYFFLVALSVCSIARCFCFFFFLQACKLCSKCVLWCEVPASGITMLCESLRASVYCLEALVVFFVVVGFCFLTKHFRSKLTFQEYFPCKQWTKSIFKFLSIVQIRWFLKVSLRLQQVCLGISTIRMCTHSIRIEVLVLPQISVILDKGLSWLCTSLLPSLKCSK